MTSLRGLALGCLLPGFEGTAPPDWVRRRVADGLGGVVLFARNVESDDQVRRLTDALRAERADVVVAIDEEGGDVTRLEARSGSSFPGNLALGFAGDASLTREVAAQMGARLRAAGVDLNLAPVVDVNSNPRNPVIGVRSFGADASAVSRHAAAWIEGMQGAGVAATAKHFPGHGDTALDSHVAVPVATDDPRLRALEPFKAAIAAGVRAIMSAHIVVPALDDLPATISPRIMTELLRDELGFGGVAISDGLDMAGLSAERGIPEAGVLALAAGCDVLCIGGGPSDESVVDALVSAIVTAVEDGRLSEDRLHGMANLKISPPFTGESPAQRAEGVVPEASRRAICSDGDIHVGGEVNLIHVDSPGSIAAGDIPWGLGSSLTNRGVRITPKGRVVIEVRDLARRNQAAVEELLARHPDAVLVEMGVPAYRPPQARAYVATHGSARVLADAAAAKMAAT